MTLAWDDMTRTWLSLTRLCLATILAMAAAAATAHAQPSYPVRTVRIICDSAPGSTPDVVARVVADGLGRTWGRQVVVINHPGGSGAIAAHFAAEAAPDGYTLYIPALSAFVAQPGVTPGIPLELPRDFAPIGFVTDNPMFISVNPALGLKTLQQLIALAKERPGKISNAVTGVGRLTHLTGELLQVKTGIKLLMVPYAAGPAHALADVIGGRVDMIVEGYSGIAAAIRSGSLNAIAVATPQRLPEFAELPTVAETIPGFTAAGWQIVVAPNGTPDAIIRSVSQDLAKVVSDPDVRHRLAQLGSYSHPMSPAEVTAFVEEQQRTWKPALQKLVTNAQ